MESTEDAIEIEDAEERGATAPTAPAGNSGLIHRLFGGYAELLRIPHAARFTVGSVVACMPLAMISMSITIGVQQIYGNYTIAGALRPSTPSRPRCSGRSSANSPTGSASERRRSRPSSSGLSPCRSSSQRRPRT